MLRQLSGQLAGLSLLGAIFLWNCQATPELVQVQSDASARITAAASTTTTQDQCDFNPANYPNPNDGWKLVFSDEFDTGDKPSGEKWTAWKSGAFNNELQLYRPENVSVASDNAIITATREATAVTGDTHPWDTTPKSFSFTSARIESNAMFTPTRTEGQVRMMARIKLPSGTGMWPAFWSYGDNWPTNGEIDILEARGNADQHQVYHTNYFYGRRANVNLVQNAESHIYTSTSLMSCYHVYELIWTKDFLRFYLDGQLVDEKTGGYIPNLFGKKQRITLNIAVGGLYFNNLATSDIANQGIMEVDWVRVYTKK
ncbi:hypothetical protein GCM10023189_59860 [Nibrella saemangeumensis]|uniref:GH16 domain-containing protein n=1 Tax=Nibrella saemangeumensis TaxID=1084526 RepID=A0ABP8NPJ3_9BACT